MLCIQIFISSWDSVQYTFASHNILHWIILLSILANILDTCYWILNIELLSLSSFSLSLSLARSTPFNGTAFRSVDSLFHPVQQKHRDEKVEAVPSFTFEYFLRSSCAISNNQETGAIGRTRNETFPTKLFYPTLNKDVKRRRETKTRRKTFSSGRMSSWSLVGSRSWNVRYRPRKIITRSSGPTVYLLYSPVHLLLSVTIPRTKFPEYLYLVSARIENFRNNFVWLKFLLKHGKPQDSPNKINIFFPPR